MTIRHAMAPLLIGAALIFAGLFAGVGAGKLLGVGGNLYVVVLAIAMTPASVYADSIRAAPRLWLTLAIWVFIAGLSIIDWIGMVNAPPAVQRAMPGLLASIAGATSHGAFTYVERRRQSPQE